MIYISLTPRLAALEVADRDLAESVLSSTYWGGEDDLDIEYSLFPNKITTLCWPTVCDVGLTLIQP